MSTDPPADETVLCIHGTFAANASDRGRAWWQRDSAFWQRFSARLPAGTRLPAPDTSLFHWSGSNSERAREHAAARLLEQLQQRERAGERYHLVGHSHGGSLIWAALRMACRRQVVLHGLRSWSTVGTPFLHKRSLRLFRWTTAIRWSAGLAVALPAVVLASALVAFVFGRAPASLALPAMAATAMVVVGCLYVCLCVASMMATPILESWQIRRDEQLDRRVMQLYGDRWLGLWSPDDEAINGLRATLDMPLSFVGRYSPSPQVFASDRLHALGRPHQWLLGWSFNLLLQPLLDRVVTAQVIKTLQGNNRPGGKIVSVHPWPAESILRRDYPPLPGWLCERLVQRADQGARNMAPQLRRLLAASPLSLADRLATQVSGSELVHTSYFEHEDIVNLLALHIAWATDDRNYLLHASQRWPQGVIWFSRFKASLGVRVSTARQSGATWDVATVDQAQRRQDEVRKLYAEIEDLVRDAPGRAA
ncbi:lipase family protein [Roseimaritima sediminicola]|uniref:alpha/beta hydrolase n=1 Tax=Roseimaritima sediminicola TaxID=2662066 RepID=UPI0012984BBD|nr:alpha/beta hydrolase [Roseimaritima sediminicola]